MPQASLILMNQWQDSGHFNVPQDDWQMVQMNAWTKMNETTNH